MKHCGGFSLVEVLCAILILGVGLAGMAHGITTALRSSKESELQTIAALIAAGQIETLRAEGQLSGGTSEGTCEAPLSSYRWVQEIAATDINGLFEVSVRVKHGEPGQRVYELQTMLFDPPPVSADDTGGNRRDRERRRR